MRLALEHVQSRTDVIDRDACRPQRRHLLTKGGRMPIAASEALPGERVDRCARAQPAVSSEVLDGDRNIVVERDRRPHVTKIAR